MRPDRVRASLNTPITERTEGHNAARVGGSHAPQF
jgi:hypothetical protein